MGAALSLLNAENMALWEGRLEYENNLELTWDLP
jgi:hypothetical protein